MSDKKVLILGFDNVLRTRESDCPVPGAIAFLLGAIGGFDVAIYSIRSRSWRGRRFMKKWLRQALREHVNDALDSKGEIGPLQFDWDTEDPFDYAVEVWVNRIMRMIRWPWTMPESYATIADDSTWAFSGHWPSITELLVFKACGLNPPTFNSNTFEHDYIARSLSNMVEDLKTDKPVAQIIDAYAVQLTAFMAGQVDATAGKSL
jgi:hypothetical protein